MYEDKIISGGEITAQGTFDAPNGAMYLFLSPKSEDASQIGILEAKISQNKEAIEYPFVAGMWNPVLINSITVDSADLSNYRIFWGATS